MNIIKPMSVSHYFKKLLVRNFEADDLLENFLVSAVSSILTVRFFLFLFHYPQLGGKGLHIAHLFWGGTLMMVAIVICLNYITKHARRLASIIGGVGFGIFIDELGKFVTSDNNYFFQPAVALIYIIFIALFLIFKRLGKYQSISETEYLVNALEFSKEAIINDLNPDEKEMALDYLKNVQNSNLTDIFSKMLQQAEIIAPKKPNVISRFYVFLKGRYKTLVKKTWFAKVVFVIFFLQASNIIGNIVLLFFFKTHLLLENPSFPRLAELTFSSISSMIAFVGIVRFRKNRLFSYRIFKYSVLVSIFLTQFFAFYTEQFLALSGLIANLIILATLNYLIFLEKSVLLSESKEEKTAETVK